MTKNKWQYPSTEGWAKIPFEVDGIEFVSAVDTNGTMYSRIMQLPREVFEAMNIGCVREVIGNVKTMTRSELVDELYRVNEGATQALILLA